MHVSRTGKVKIVLFVSDTLCQNILHCITHIFAACDLAISLLSSADLSTDSL